jgi:mono/diheme cytochrome c family protein
MSKSRLLLVAAALSLTVAPVARAADGETIYKTNCAKCHGATGAADTPAAKSLKVPSLQGDANVKKMSAADVAARIKGNAKHPPAIKGLSQADMDAVAAYVKTLVAK